MGFSVSGSAAIVFLGLLIAFGMFFTATANGFEAVSEARQDRTDRTLKQQNTEMNLTGATYYRSNETLTATVTNDGSSQLVVGGVDLLLDNRYVSDYETTVDGDAATTLWFPQEELTITVTSVGSPPDRAKVVSGPGVADTALVEVV